MTSVGGYMNLVRQLTSLQVDHLTTIGGNLSTVRVMTSMQGLDNLTTDGGQFVLPSGRSDGIKGLVLIPPLSSQRADRGRDQPVSGGMPQIQSGRPGEGWSGGG
jgi:hypothetical protein